MYYLFGGERVNVQYSRCKRRQFAGHAKDLIYSVNTIHESVVSDMAGCISGVRM